MKKVLTILVTVVFLASGLHISIDKHFCGGSLHSTMISLTQAKASCGMKSNDAGCTDRLAFGSRCCEDQLSCYTLDNIFSYVLYRFDRPIPVQKDLSIHYTLLRKIDTSDPCPSGSVLPPGLGLRDTFSLSEFCVFRI